MVFVRTRRHSPENNPTDAAIVIPAKAGIQFPAPAISLAATERPSSFSCFVVSVATDMSDSSENSPRPTGIRRGGFQTPSAPTNSTKWGVTYLIYPCSTTVTASKDTNARINPPLASTIVFDRLESRRKWRDSSRPSDAFPKLKWQLVGANGFKPAPQYQRHPHTVIPAKERHPVPRYGAGIHPPAISHLRTDSPIPFSSSVVSVATDIGGCYKNMPSQPVVGATLVVARPRCKRPSPI